MCDIIQIINEWNPREDIKEFNSDFTTVNRKKLNGVCGRLNPNLIKIFCI